MSIEGYIGQLSISSAAMPAGGLISKGAPVGPASTPVLPADLQAAVDAGSILSFVSDVGPGEKADILFSVQLAQRAANAAFDRFAQTKSWYAKYNEVLEAVGWATEQFAFASHDQSEGDFVMDKAALAVITAIATGNQLGAITASISALEKLADNDGAITLFDFNAASEGSGNFQIGAVEKSTNGALSMALGAFYFRGVSDRQKFLFFKWGSNEVNFWTAAQKMTFNTAIYDKVRGAVQQKLGKDALGFISGIKIR
jgi:hypothetical protein